MVDLTTLEGADTAGKVRSLCAKARRPDPDYPDTPAVAAVCVYPDMVADAVAALAGSDVGIASVATAFPAGRASIAVKLADVRDALDAGATEVDMVIDRGAFLAGDIGKVFDEIVAVKQVCGDVALKVILETGELGTYDSVRRASWLALLAGGDFIKTSTGKINPAATLPVIHVMLQAVRDFAARDRPAARGEGGRRHPQHQGRDPVPGRGERGRRPGVVVPQHVPVRCIEPAERPADAAAVPADRRLQRPELRDG